MKGGSNRRNWSGTTIKATADSAVGRDAGCHQCATTGAVMNGLDKLERLSP